MIVRNLLHAVKVFMVYAKNVFICKFWHVKGREIHIVIDIMHSHSQEGHSCTHTPLHNTVYHSMTVSRWFWI